MVEQLSNRPLFQRILGSEFEQLPEPIRSLHAVTTLTLAEGRCTVTRGGNVLARLLARLLSLPPDCRDGKIQLVMRRRDELEVWVRTIAGRRFVSTLRQSGPGQVTERIGPVDFDFALRPGATELAMSLRAVRVFGLSLPQRLWPRITARETVADGRFRFDIVTSLPGIGQIVAYSGTLAAIEDRAGAFAGRPVVLFDGICNLCNRSVNFLLRWDHEGGSGTQRCSPIPDVGFCGVTACPRATTTPSLCSMAIRCSASRRQSCTLLDAWAGHGASSAPSRWSLRRSVTGLTILSPATATGLWGRARVAGFQHPRSESGSSCDLLTGAAQQFPTECVTSVTRVFTASLNA